MKTTPKKTNSHHTHLTDAVAQWDETVLELLGVESARSALVEVVEAGSELVQLLLGDSLAVSGKDLVLYLVDGSVDGGDQLLPPNTEGLHGVLGVSVFKHKALLQNKDLKNTFFQFYKKFID